MNILLIAENNEDVSPEICNSMEQNPLPEHNSRSVGRDIVKLIS